MYICICLNIFPKKNYTHFEYFNYSIWFKSFITMAKITSSCFAWANNLSLISFPVESKKIF